MTNKNDNIEAYESDELRHGSAKESVYEIFIMVVTAHALINLLLMVIIPKTSPIQEVLRIGDWYTCVVFLLDFFRSLIRANDKRGYFFHWGWLDLLGSFPHLIFFRVLRIARTLRSYRVLHRRKFRLKDAWRAIKERRAESTLLAMIVAVLIIITIGGSAVVIVEGNAPNAEIQTGGDAVWWAITTVSTVGYGDYVPITPEGRLIGTIMMFLGVSVFTVLTSYLSTSFLDQRSQRIEKAQTTELRAELDEIKALLHDIQRSQQS